MARIRAAKKKMGVKDPEAQKEKREAKFKNKNGPGLQKGMDRPLRPIPVFQQQKGESVKSFVRRMGQTTKSMIRQRKYEEKFGIEFKIDPKTGQQVMVKPEKTEEEKLKFEKKKKRLAKRGIHVRNEEEIREHKLEYKKELRMRKKRSKLEESEALQFSDFQDRPEFGEIVHEPPKITFKARKAEKLVKQNKVGGLLLAKKFENAGGKKKKEFQDMSLAKKAQMEQERDRVIKAYRAIRTDKYAKVNAAREEKDEADAFFKK